jgi:hypothetical protein
MTRMTVAAIAAAAVLGAAAVTAAAVPSLTDGHHGTPERQQTMHARMQTWSTPGDAGPTMMGRYSPGAMMGGVGPGATVNPMGRGMMGTWPR